MVYITSANKTRQDRIAEVRVNLRQVHNKYFEKKDYCDGYQSIDLSEYCDTEDPILSEKFCPFIDIAVQIEGIEEALADSSEKEFVVALNELTMRLKEIMKGV